MDLRTISLAVGTVLIAGLLHELTEDLRVALRGGFVYETLSVSSQNIPSNCSPCLIDIVSLLRIKYGDQLVHGYISIRYGRASHHLKLNTPIYLFLKLPRRALFQVGRIRSYFLFFCFLLLQFKCLPFVSVQRHSSLYITRKNAGNTEFGQYSR